jgi:hypothetical protein
MRHSIKPTVWSRWKAFALRAAQVQCAILLWLLYWMLLVPMAWLRPRARSGWRGGLPAPTWQRRLTHSADLPSARRQF